MARRNGTRIALVTGGASGIGRSVAKELVRRGDWVLVTDINEAGAKKVAEELTDAGPGAAEAAFLDVTNGAAVAAAVHELKDRFGRLDIIVNNAGVGTGGFAHQITLEHWRKAVDINLRGVVHGVDAAYKVMVEQGHGHIINVASVAGFVPGPIVGPYVTTKHAVYGLSQSLRAEAAAHGVGVTVVCPGAVKTNIWGSVNDGVESMGAFEDLFKMGTNLVSWAMYSPDKLARDILKGIDRNKIYVIEPLHAKAAWYGVRAVPVAPVVLGAVGAAALKMVRRVSGA